MVKAGPGVKAQVNHLLAGASSQDLLIQILNPAGATVSVFEEHFISGADVNSLKELHPSAQSK